MKRFHIHIGVFDEGETTCCYAESNKAWAKDPSGLAWETYQNMADAEVFSAKKEAGRDSGCCASGSDDESSGCG